jgi:hypothetical protein
MTHEEIVIISMLACYRDIPDELFNDTQFLQSLSNAGMLTFRKFPEYPELTEKAKAYAKMLEETPLPESIWVDPRKKKED